MRFILVAISTSVALVIVEGFLRFQEPYLRLMKDKAEWALGRYRAHPIWHHWIRPNQITAWPTHDPKTYPELIIYRTNDLGCRADPHSKKSSGSYRILVLGDSFTEGYYLEDSFAQTLERKLNGTGSVVTYDVINCGTSSYSPLLHYLRYRHQLHELEADEVIINIDLTDVFDDNWRYAPQTTFSSEGEPLFAREPRKRMTNVADALRFRYYTARLLMGQPSQQIYMPVTQNIFAYYRDLPTDSERWQHDVGFTLDMIRRLITLITDSGAKVTVTMYPYRQHFESVNNDVIWNREFEYRVRDATLEMGASFYSAFADIQPLFERGLPLYWATDFHFTPIGQKAWSEAFATHYLQQQASR